MVKTWKWGRQEEGIRYEIRQPPLWMKMNLREGRCWCGKPKELFEPRYRKYCCYEHSQLWFYSIRSYWPQFRMEIIRRDDYTCQECGFAVEKKRYGKDSSCFDVDHILAISLGGMCFDANNVRTLCKKCHRKKTGSDFRKLKYKKWADGMMRIV